MNKHFPDEMIRAAKLGKMSFFSDIVSPSGSDCENCGGMGVLILFIADEGPYSFPGAPYRGYGKTSKWYDGKWWLGNSNSFTCPDCKGECKKR